MFVEEFFFKKKISSQTFVFIRLVFPQSDCSLFQRRLFCFFFFKKKGVFFFRKSLVFC